MIRPAELVSGRLIPIVVTIAAVLAGVHAIDASPVGVFYDDALYAILGKSIASGQGYRYISIPGAPAATHYPPGYPALLALLWRISPSFPENVALFKMVNALLLGVVALFTFSFARTRLELSELSSAFTAIASTVAIPALLLSSNVVSEVLFLALLLPVLPFAERECVRGGASRAAMLGLAVGLLCLVRSHAVALIPAIAIAYALERRYREAAIATAAGVLTLMPWLWWVQRHDPLIPLPLRGQYGSYGAWLAEGLRAQGAGLLLASLRDNVMTCVAIIARSFSLARNAVLDAIAVVSVLTLCAAGAVVFARRARVTLLFVAMYMAIVLVWPFSPLRFVWGIWPIVVLFMVSGARSLWHLELGPRKLGRGVALVTAAVALIGAMNFNVRGYVNAWWATVSRSMGPRIQPQLVWVTERTGPSDVIAADDEGAVYLYTGRLAVPTNSFTTEQYFRPRSAQESAPYLAEMLRVFAPTYVLAMTVPTMQAASLLSTAAPPLLTLADTMPGGRVYVRPKR